MRKYIVDNWPFAIFLTFFVVTVGFKLIYHPTPFYDWDESIYMQVGHEMIAAKSPVPLWQGAAWLEKPPLAPLLYGIISALPGQAELTTRLFSLLLTAVAIFLTYQWVMKATKNKFVAFLTAVMTSFTPLFLQRAQIVNTDVLLLIGWLGYLLYYPRFWPSLLFLFLGVYSKSLLGFYPIFIIGALEIYRLTAKQITKTKFIRILKFFAIQLGIMSLWFIAMYLIYGNYFLQVHFYDHLLKRVTSSIESHFGHRTFYIDIIYNQFGPLLLMLLVSLLLLARRFLQKKITEYEIVYSLFFIPWFLFLNITKTKISWYAYPVIPQFTFLIVYPISAIKNYKPILYVVTILFTGYLLFQAFFTFQFFTTFYSSNDANIQLAKIARSKCNLLDVLIDPDGRKTYEVLKGMNLVITTSTWYGNHPSTVYYFGKKVNFIYDKSSLASQLARLPKSECLMMNEEDTNLPLKEHGFTPIRNIDHLLLFQKSIL